MKVLLISANTETISMPVLPLGMAFVARAAEDAGHEVTQINLMAESESLKTLTERIHSSQPDVIGISVRNIDDQVSLKPRFLLDPVKAIISTCRQNSRARIVLGGAGYSIFPRRALEYLGADFKASRAKGNRLLLPFWTDCKMVRIYRTFPACIMSEKTAPTLQPPIARLIGFLFLSPANTCFP